ncbi:cadherin-like beta sandwich domain-containing protein [Paenibacillus sp. TRM 82003]|nr:cadherin-like beta sandwich domain-containing protein [Paenibacillus sp. TRM 82003]
MLIKDVSGFMLSLRQPFARLQESVDYDHFIIFQVGVERMSTFPERGKRWMHRTAIGIMVLVLSPLYSLYFNDVPKAYAAGPLTMQTAQEEGRRITTKYLHSLAVKADGTVEGWGVNDDGRLDIPTELNNVVSVATSMEYSIALKEDGTVVGWGPQGDLYPHNKYAAPPKRADGAIAIASTFFDYAALKSDGTVVTWGYNYSGGSFWNQPVSFTGVVALAGGMDHFLALKSDGTVVSWGVNGRGAPPADLTDVAAIAAGYEHSLALKTDGTVVTWGNNLQGQLDVPADLSDVVAISAGHKHSLALRADGTVVGWGSNDYGQLDVPAGLTGVVAVEAGHYHSIALKADGTIVAWGDLPGKGLSDVPSGLKVYDMSIADIQLHSGAALVPLNAPFQPNTDSYSAEAGGGSIDVTAVLANSKYAGLRVNGSMLGSGAAKTVPLQMGGTTITLEVADAIFGDIWKTYTVTIARKITSADINDGTITHADLSEELKRGFGRGIMMTVVAGQAFRTGITGYDELADGAKDAGGSVTLHNQDVADGYVQISGTLTDPGVQSIVIDGVSFLFQVIPAPTAATVTTTFE